MPIDLPMLMTHSRTGKSTPVEGKRAAESHATEEYPKEPPAGARVTPRHAPERKKAPVTPPPPKNARMRTVRMLPTLETDLNLITLLPYAVGIEYDH